MKPDFVVLADAGHVRDGLVYVIGGGIDQINTTDLPAVVQATVVARILMDPEDFGRDHELLVRVRREDPDEQVALLRGGFHADSPPAASWDPGWVTALKLDGLLLPSYGYYRLALEVDEQVMKEIRIRVQPVIAPSRAQRRHRPSPRSDPTVRPKARRR